MELTLIRGPYISHGDRVAKVTWEHMTSDGCLLSFTGRKRDENPFTGAVSVERPFANRIDGYFMVRVPATSMPTEKDMRLYLDWCLHQINEVGLKLEKEVTIMEGVAGEQVELFFDRATEHYNIFKCRGDGEHPIVYLNKEASEGLDSVLVVWTIPTQPEAKPGMQVGTSYLLDRMYGDVYKDKEGNEVRFAEAYPHPPDTIQVTISSISTCHLCNQPILKGDGTVLFGPSNAKVKYHRHCFEAHSEALIEH